MSDPINAFGTVNDGFITTHTLREFRTESTVPFNYRLTKKPDGTLVLQGAYAWREGFGKSGHEWRDIPTVDIP